MKGRRMGEREEKGRERERVGTERRQQRKGRVLINN